MSTEEEDEFEDALDSLPGLPNESTCTPSRPSQLAASQPLLPSSATCTPSHHGPATFPAVSGRPQIATSMPPPLLTPSALASSCGPSITTPITATTVIADPSMSARQERLNNLRRRLRDEFGHTSRGRTPSSVEASDSISLTSDQTSLHSWHHSLLGGNMCVVRPADTMSTRAGSSMGGAGQFSPTSPSSPPPAVPPPKRASAPPPLPPRPASIRLPDPVAAEVLKRIAESERLAQAAAASPEAIDNDRSRDEGDVEETMVQMNELTLMATQGPSSSVQSPIALSPPSSLLDARPRSKSTREDESPTKERERKTSQPHNTSTESMEQQGSAASSAGTLTGSTSNTLINPTSPLSGQNASTIERRRGHTKTNSLDRGLTLAKCIKTGPWPPPSSKTISLTRGQQGPNFEVEEEERNCLADQVIQQLTTSVIGETSAIVTSVEESLRRPSQLGAIPSCSSSSPSSSASSSVSSTKGERRGGGAKKHEEKYGSSSSNGRRMKDKERHRDTLSIVTESPEHQSSASTSLPRLDVTSDTDVNAADNELSSPWTSPLAEPESGITVGSSRSLPLHDRSMGARLEEYRDVGANHPSADTSYDPITRDVERRMSMKGHGQVGGVDGSTRGDKMDDETTSIAGSTLSHAGSAVREYASGLLRGVVSRARSVMHLTASSSSKAAIESEMSDSDSEMDDPSLPDSASVAGRQSTASTSNGIVRPRNAKKGPFDFAELKVVQELTNEHTGAVWCVRFSICGRLMATAGHDTIIRVWCVRSALSYFNNMREKYQQKRGSCASSSNNSFDGFDRTMADLESDIASSYKPTSSEAGDSMDGGGGSSEEGESPLFANKPFAVFKGHTADVLDLSWSKNYFILSSGMDRTVKLWHLSRSECLCCFQHVDFVTCVSFLPKDDRYFLSGSLDGKLRMWHIPDKKVAIWNEVAVKFITALAFAKSGKFAVVGTFNGRCYFYSTDQLKYHTVVDVRSTRGKNARGHKVTGLAVHGDKLLVTSNDSRIRMYDVRDKALTCKFKGAQNERSQIRAQFSPDGKHIVCGSEDRYVYLWRTSDLPPSLSVRKDRNAQWERARAHNQPVSVACFAPKPAIFLQMMQRAENAKKKGQSEAYRGSTAAWAAEHAAPPSGDVIISADLSGCIKVMVNRHKPVKLGQSTFFPS